MRARREPPPPPSLALVVHHHTTPRTYIFPGGSPTFATITPVAAAFVRATHARCPSCRVHAEDGSRDSFFERVRIFVSPRASQPFDISTLWSSTKWCSSFPVSSPLRKGDSIVVVACTFGTRPATCNPFFRAGLREGYGTCVPRGLRRKVHLPLLLSRIRQAGTTVSERSGQLLQNNYY